MTYEISSWPEAEGAARATALFTGAFDAAPAGVWASPGRVNLIGEHLDYNGGSCVPIALPHATYVALSPREDDRVRITSAGADPELWTGTLADIRPGGGQPTWVSYALGVAWALARAGHELRGVDAAVVSCVPTSAGLSSSAAIECAVGLALVDTFDLPLTRPELVLACQQAENDVVGAPTGTMDQSASLLADEGRALALNTLDGSTELVPFDLTAHGLSLLVIDTRASHALVDGQYASRRTTCETVAAREGVRLLGEVTDADELLGRLDDPVEFKRVRHVMTEIGRVERFIELVRAGDYDRIGPLLDASHASLRDDYEVSCPELDAAVEAARAAGALGARMTGGGFGGSAIALVPTELLAQVEQAVEQAYAEHGWAEPRFIPAVAAKAGRKVR
ncbi:galactokinase [Propionibacterium australiense]|uniref:Galactokinase n=1 Tax=Propionibacterium australiense TaxID=119981 RepID=A0A383S5Z3_9ACTN|nr:galactokinase [Propionibacterium australiense]RLP09768.1 galactokinase [Propionibacterium australiense]SYZ33243.1 galactokinase [Propionibacterium australiense]VEH89263.1 Galactokinase [Propionibacterium australiense]